MPKERCPVCGIEITHKNLARHIKLRHGIKYKFCYKCRKLIPNQQYPEHRARHETSRETESLNSDQEEDKQINNDNSITDMDQNETIEIPEELLDQAIEDRGAESRYLVCYFWSHKVIQ